MIIELLIVSCLLARQLATTLTTATFIGNFSLHLFVLLCFWYLSVHLKPSEISI